MGSDLGLSHILLKNKRPGRVILCFNFSIILFITPKLKIYIDIKQFIKVYPVASFIWAKNI